MRFLPQAAGVLAAALLAVALLLVRRLRRTAAEHARLLTATLEDQRSRSAGRAARVMELENVSGSALFGVLTRRLGVLEAVSGAITRDLEQALASGDRARLDAAARRSADRAARLARLASGGRAVEWQTSLAAIWPRVRALVAPRIGEAHTVRADLSERLPPVAGGGEEWVQLLAALVENALAAMPAGGLVEVCAAVLPSGTAVRVAVKDTGTGIRQDALAHVFEPFYTSHAESGAEGLGLAVVAALAEGMGGEVQVSSEEGRGTEVAVMVPVAAPAPARAALALAGTFLVADDDADMRSRIARMIRSFGAEALEVDSGTAARSRLLAEPGRFAGAVLDVVMPGTPVGDVVAEIRARRPEFPVLLISGYDTMQAVDAVLALGGVRFLRKPFEREELHRNLADLAAGRAVTPATSPAPPPASAAPAR